MEQQDLQRQIEQYEAPPHVTSFLANLEPASSMDPIYRCESFKAHCSSDGLPDFYLSSEWPPSGGDADLYAPGEDVLDH